MAIRIPAAEAAEILKHFRINPPTTDARFLEHAEIERGIKAVIEGYSDPDFGNSIRVSIGSTVVSRACPLTAWLAQGIAGELRERGAIPPSVTLGRALAHLVRRCSTMYEKSGISMFALNPVYVSERGYRIVGALMEHTGPLHVPTRLSPDAHDRRAQFAYRRTATKTGKR